MAGPLMILLIGSLLQGCKCNVFQINLPKIVQVMTGSCVTVPCSFDVEDKYEQNLNKQCTAIWRSTSTGNVAQLTDRNPQTGDLTKKNCTTTFSNMQTGPTKDYYFRIDCNNPLLWSYSSTYVKIEVTDNFPSPTLTPSTLKIKEGESVSLTCSAPAPCLPHPPTLIWTPKLGDIQETLQENQDKTKFKTSVMNFTASHLYNKLNISCTAGYKKQDGGSDAALTTSLIPDVLYSPKNVTVSVSPSGSVVENSNVTLTCNSDANPAEQNYTWYGADGGQETVIGTGKIFKMKVKTDTKMFFCKAVNEIGKQPSNITHIDVLYSPKNVTVSVSPSGSILENSNVTLTCNSDANPAEQNYIWYRADGGQETVFGTGKILNITVSMNRKSFFCKAENDVGEQHSNITHIDVLYSPKNVTVSVSPSGPVLENSNVSLTCNSDANPAEQNYTWYRADGGQETVIGTGKILYIILSTNQKSFFCKAENDVGEQHSNITHIDVLYSPKNVTVSVSPSGSVLENSNVTLTCSSDANPAEQNYTWYEVKAAQEIVTGTGNTLNTTVSTDKDIFFCKAQNDVGEERSNLRHIDVLFPARILFSSKCMKTSNQVSCFCDTAGNPSPTTHWNLHGKPITQPSQMVITHESLNNSYLRSIITIVEPQDRDLSTLQCFSYNSLGSASKGFCVRCLDNSKENESQILMPVLIGSAVAFLLIICALLVVVWFQKTHYKPKSVAATSGQQEAKEQTKADNSQPSTGTDLSCNNPEKMSKSSADKSEDVVYARLKWRENTKVKEEDIYVNLELSDGSCLNEKKCENGGEHSVSKKEELKWRENTKVKEEDIYVNLELSDGSCLNEKKCENGGEHSVSKKEELKWRENTKVKEEDIYVNLELSDGSCLNEKKCENGGEHSVSNKEEIESMRAEDKIKNIRKESEVVYAQVKFQTKTPESQ